MNILQRLRMTPPRVLRNVRAWLCFAALFTTVSAPGLATVEPNGIFGPRMVLQRGMPVPVWGKAAPGEKVTVTFAGQEKSAVADESGAWKVTLDALEANGTGGELQIVGTNKLVFPDVLVGDVWLCSGQSNMAYGMQALRTKPEYAADLTSADFPLIRQGTVPREPSVDPADSRKVPWTVCSPATVDSFTAAGFYFARELQKEIGVPIGLILAAWGGTSAESWTSKSALDTVPEFKERADEQLANLQQLPGQIAAFPAAIADWEQTNGRSDPGNKGEEAGWMNAGSADGWTPGKLKTKWADLGLRNGGVAWLRREIQVPNAEAGKPFRLDLGMVNEQRVTVYWNGRKIGDFGSKAPVFYKGYAGFDVPGGDVRPGPNVLALRFVTHLGDRAPVGRTWEQMGLKRFGISGEDVEVKVESEFAPLDASAIASRPKAPEGDAAHTSSTLFGGMIHPLIPFALRGVLWYQGEQDASRALAYRQLLPLMVNDWREQWGQGDFPFLIQQLPNWKAGGATDTGWAELREAQWMTAQKLPNTLISIGVEIGESDDVHPSNKREIGRRLSLLALDKVYAKGVPSAGPIMVSADSAGDGTYRVKFRATGELKTRDGNPPALFAVAGANRQFVPASATIGGGEVLVRAPDGVVPEALRYAWINDTAAANLTDDTGLPAAPFRTDDWPIRGQK